MASKPLSARERNRWGGADNAKTLRLMEGYVAQLQEMSKTPSRLPAQRTHVWLANKFGVSAATMNKRLRDAMAKQGRHDNAALFCELWGRIGDLLADQVRGTISTIALDTEHNKSFDAARWLVERYDKEEQMLSAATAKSGSLVADIEQEVWDEMTPEEDMAVSEIELAIQAEMHKLGRLVRRVQKRVVDRRANEDEDEIDD